MAGRRTILTEDRPLQPVKTLLFASAARIVFLECLSTTTLMVGGSGNAERLKDRRSRAKEVVQGTEMYRWVKFYSVDRRSDDSERREICSHDEEVWRRSKGKGERSIWKQIIINRRGLSVS
ncbi:hypothetical protein EJB05_48570, partial [Eragrostis curvula]